LGELTFQKKLISTSCQVHRAVGRRGRGLLQQHVARARDAHFVLPPGGRSSRDYSPPGSNHSPPPRGRPSWHPDLRSQPSAPNPQPYTLNPELFPQPYTLNPEPCPPTLHPKPQTLNPKPQTLNPQPQTPNPQPQPTNPNPPTANKAPRTRATARSRKAHPRSSHSSPPWAPSGA